MAKIKAKKSILDIMDNQDNKKGKKLKEKRVKSDTETEIQRFIIIFVVVLLVLGIFYLITTKVVNKRKEESEETKTEINYDIVTVGTLLNRPYYNYYVLIYDSTMPTAKYYDVLFDDYKNMYDKKIYFCDLNKSFNKKYASKDGKGNINAKTIEDFSFGEITLLEIEKHEVVNYYEDIAQINDLLSVR